MATKSELLKVPAFAELPEDQIEWFLSHSEEMRLQPGETYIQQGAPADAMFVLSKDSCTCAENWVAKASYSPSSPETSVAACRFRE